MYVPLDPSDRRVAIVHHHTPHNHPMPPLTKVSLQLKESYQQCIAAFGTVGATVAKVDNGM